MYGFYNENRDYIHAFIVVAVICIAGIWFVHDYHRNDGIHNDTDRTMESVEKRLDDIGKRIDDLQARTVKTQKTIGSATVEIRESRETADTIARGVTEAEQRIDNAIQVSGRIKNRIADIETANQQREKNP